MLFTNKVILDEIKDYFIITIGLISYAIAWPLFLMPYQISIGGTTGIASIIYYATGFPIQNTYLIINVFLLLFAFKLIGFKFSIKTTYAVFMLTFLLWLFQELFKNEDGKFSQLMGPGQELLACILGGTMCGFGLGITFTHNGSTGGTDIIAAIVNKYYDVTLGRIIMLSDIVIISSCYFIFNDWKRVIFGMVTLFFISIVIDYVVNSSRQSVQFIIFSKKYDMIADRITVETHRGVTVLDGEGWYSHGDVKVLIVLAYKRQSQHIFKIVKSIDPNAFISQSSVIGVYGEGFDKIKAKV